MEKGSGKGFDWAGLLAIATVARLLCRELTLQNEYLRLENRVPKEKVSGRIRFADEKRRPLMRMSSAREVALRALWGTDESLDITGAWQSPLGPDQHRAPEPRYRAQIGRRGRAAAMDHDSALFQMWRRYITKKRKLSRGTSGGTA